MGQVLLVKIKMDKSTEKQEMGQVLLVKTVCIRQRNGTSFIGKFQKGVDNLVFLSLKQKSKMGAKHLSKKILGTLHIA